MSALAYNLRFVLGERAMQFSILPIKNTLDPVLHAKIDNKTKPLGALGQLERLALQVGRIQQSLTPKFSQPHLLVFAGDHGAAKAGVSAFPQDVTWQMVENFLVGGAAINVFARQNGLALKVIDAGVAHDFGERDRLIDASIGHGTRNYIDEPAMSSADCAAAPVSYTHLDVYKRQAEYRPLFGLPVVDRHSTKREAQASRTRRHYRAGVRAVP